MTSRERMLAAFRYEGPDRIPVVHPPSPAGLHVHGRKLLDLFNAYPPDNAIAFDHIPGPPPGTVDAEGRYREFRTDDWGTQTAQMISTDLFRRIYKPRYRELMEKAKAAGKLVFFHCCGYLGSLFDELLDLGIDGFWPQITRYDPATFPATCMQHGVTVYIHPDRQQLIPLGTPEEIDARIRAYADTYHELEGGGIFYVEIENDAPFRNVEALIEAVHRYR